MVPAYSLYVQGFVYGVNAKYGAALNRVDSWYFPSYIRFNVGDDAVYEVYLYVLWRLLLFLYEFLVVSCVFCMVLFVNRMDVNCFDSNYG